MSDTLTTQEIACQFGTVARLNRAIEYADKRARNAMNEGEKFNWIHLASNLRAQRSDAFYKIDTLVFGPFAGSYV